MHPVALYRQFASDSRLLAAMLANPVDKQALELMAAGWDKIADNCEAMLRRSKGQLAFIPDEGGWQDWPPSAEIPLAPQTVEARAAKTKTPSRQQPARLNG